MTRFTDKVALITGGGQGIGRAAVLRFAQEGADIVIADRNPQTAQQVVEEVEALGQKALAIEADVTQAADCERVISQIVAHFGQLDVVFSNAGVSGGDVVTDMDPAEWQRVININLTGVFLTCKYSIPALIKAGGGAIVNMASSMAGWDATMAGAAYMASKEGVAGLTKSLALQLGGYNIRVNAICPGVIKTRLSFKPGMSEAEWEAAYDRFAERIPLRRVGQPEDVAATVAFLASDDARHITGSALLIDGGQTLQSWSNAPDEGTYPWHLED